MLSSKDFDLQRRLSKVVIPFLFWAVSYYFWYLYVLKDDSFLLIDFVKEIIKGHSTAHLPAHLWFLPLIISIYFVVPLLKYFLNYAKHDEVRNFIVTLCIFSIALPVTQKLLGIDTSSYKPFVFTIFILYFISGVYLIQNKYSTKLSLLFYILGFFITLYTHWSFNADSMKFNNYAYRPEFIGIVFMTLSFFIIIKNISLKKDYFLIKILATIGKLSFGIYLIHIFWQQILMRGYLGFSIHPKIFASIIAIPSMTIIVLGLSIVSILIIKKIPYAAKILPD